MSQENVERLRAALEGMADVTWDTAPLTAWARQVALFDPDIVYEDATMFDQTFHGVEGIADSFRRWNEAFGSTKVELLDVTGEGDRVVSVQRFRAVARLTGIEFTGEYAYAWTFRNGRVVHYRSVADRAEALRAVGLEE